VLFFPRLHAGPPMRATGKLSPLALCGKHRMIFSFFNASFPMVAGACALDRPDPSLGFGYIVGTLSLSSSPRFFITPRSEPFRPSPGSGPRTKNRIMSPPPLYTYFFFLFTGRFTFSVRPGCGGRPPFFAGSTGCLPLPFGPPPMFFGREGELVLFFFDTRVWN